MSNLDQTKVRRLVAVVAAAGSLALAGSASATVIQVGTATMNMVKNGVCSFPEAVDAVNNPGPAVPSSLPRSDCAAANGNNDRIDLRAETYTTPSQLDIRRSVEIRGLGVGSTALNTSAVIGLVIYSPTNSAMVVKLTKMTIRDVHPSFPVTGIYVDGTGSLNDPEALKVLLDEVRIADCSNHGIYAGNRALLDISRSTIENNGNSGIQIDHANLFMYESLIRNNHGTLGGGIDFSGEGNNNIYNSTFTGNSAQRGGGLYVVDNTGAYLNLHNVTVAYNDATEQGGGIFDATTAGNTRPGALSSIVAKNTAPLWRDMAGIVQCSRTLHGQTQDTTAANHVDDIHPVNGQDVDPKLGPLMDMGGPTLVYPLLKGSPALDYGPTEAGEGARDQRGFPRQWNGNVDLGAYEEGPRETELLAVAAKTANIVHENTNVAVFSNGFATILRANATNQFVTYRVAIHETGSYQLRVQIRRGNNHGIVQLAVAPTLNGTYVNIAAPLDHYRATPATDEIILGNVTATSVGQKFFRFRTTGKNAASSSFNFIIDYIYLIKL